MAAGFAWRERSGYSEWLRDVAPRALYSVERRWPTSSYAAGGLLAEAGESSPRISDSTATTHCGRLCEPTARGFPSAPSCSAGSASRAQAVLYLCRHTVLLQYALDRAARLAPVEQSVLRAEVSVFVSIWHVLSRLSVFARYDEKHCQSLFTIAQYASPEERILTSKRVSHLS